MRVLSYKTETEKDSSQRVWYSGQSCP